MPLNDIERIAYDLLTSLTVEDLDKPLEALPKVLTAFEKSRAPLAEELAGIKRLKEAADRAHLTQTLIRSEHLSSEDATRLVDNFEEHPFQYEVGPCRACDGDGRYFEPGCMGGRYQDCKKCRGRNPKRQFRIRLFWAPCGDPVTLDDYFGGKHDHFGG